MARARKLDSLDAYRRALRKGYGLGTGKDYLPWLTVRDVPSLGTSAIIRGYKTGRDHHCLSQQEKYFFLLAEISPWVVDIREQFPLLPLDLVRHLAQVLRINYPEIPGKKVPDIRSTDFLLTLQKRDSVEKEYLAVSVKMEEDLGNPRTLEKLELERVWWELLGVKFQLFICSHELKQRALDIEWLTDGVRFEGWPDRRKLETACSSIGLGIYPVAALIETIGHDVSVEENEARNILKCLIVGHYITIDWSTPILTSQLINVTGEAHKKTSYAAG